MENNIQTDKETKEQALGGFHQFFHIHIVFKISFLFIQFFNHSFDQTPSGTVPCRKFSLPVVAVSLP